MHRTCEQTNARTIGKDGILWRHAHVPQVALLFLFVFFLTISLLFVCLVPVEIGMKVFQTAHLGHSYAVEVWDIPGDTKSEDLFRSQYLPQMDGALIVADAADLRSFQCVRKWADLFAETALLRLADNLAALGLDENASEADSLGAHSLRSGGGGGNDPQGRGGSQVQQQLVSTLPVVLFANKSESEKRTLSPQDIADSARHFKLSAGLLGSALVNKSVLPVGTPVPLQYLPFGAQQAAAAAAAAVAAPGGAGAGSLSSLQLHPSDSGVDQTFHFLLGEMLKYQHLISVTPALARVQAPAAVAAAAAAQTMSARHNERDRALSHQSDGMSTQRAQAGSRMDHAQLGLTSRRLLSSVQGPAVPLPPSLASLRQRSGPVVSARGPSAFSFDTALASGSAASAAAASAAPKANNLAAAAAAQQADAAAARAQAVAAAAESDDEEDEDDGSSDDDDDDESESDADSSGTGGSEGEGEDGADE